MNSFFQKFTASLGLAATVTLVSCQNSDLVLPTKPVTISVEAPNDIINSGLAKKYTLTKHGQASLSYLRDGRLQKAMYGPGPISYPYDYVYYTYNAQSIKATSYAGSTVVGEELYLIDANTDRCYESKTTSFTFYSNGTVVFEKSWIYQYNAAGQLKSRANKSNPTERTDYTFTAAGDMSKAISYGTNGIATKEVTFVYDQPVGDPILTDYYPLNSDLASLTDPYLRIFGKASKHLVKLVTQKNSPAYQLQINSYYTYTQDAAGYVTTQKEYNVANAALLSTKTYGYLITNIGLLP